MRTTEIENQLRHRPFLPFQLRMSDGRAYDVRHPQMLLVSRTIIAVAIHTPRVRESEGIVLCDPVHTIRIDPLGDGRSRARTTRHR
jgi:hypothetical protein